MKFADHVTEELSLSLSRKEKKQKGVHSRASSLSSYRGQLNTTTSSRREKKSIVGGGGVGWGVSRAYIKLWW